MVDVFSGNNKKINLQEVVSLLGVSSATIKNWVRHKYLTPKNDDKKILFLYSEVSNLKNRIVGGEIDRLNKRANKRNSSITFIPDEYADNEDVISLIQKIVGIYQTKLLNQKSILLAVVLNLLKQKGLASFTNDLKRLDAVVPKNKVVTDELKWWINDVGNDFQDYAELVKMELPKISDILGLVYQSIVAEGSKAQAGSYYTPRKIVDEIVAEYVGPQSLVLDPCCGTGQFLLSTSDVVKNPSNIWGVDIDETAVRIARINLLAKFPNRNFVPNIYSRNTLLDITTDNIPKFDVVITNPPWGVHFSQSETTQLQSTFPSIKSNEAFSYFLAKGIDLLKNKGVLSFVLPEAILNVKTHSDIRTIILEHTKIKKIKLLGRSFKNVFTPVVRLDVIKKKPVETDEIEIENGKKYKTQQFRLKSNPNYVFDVFNEEKDLEIIDKVYSLEHRTLKNQAEWALGIVTGNNKKYLLGQRVKTAEPILTGKDIKRFVFNSPQNFVKFASNRFQQVASENKYRAKEKLIYKFISKNLVFSYDKKGTLTINSANILIPKVSDYPIKTILALFNSSLYQFIYKKKFNSIKVLRGNLEQLPLPKLTSDQHKKIGQLVQFLLSKNLCGQDRKTKYINLDKIIMDIFSLSIEEKEYIKSKTKVSEKLLTN